MICYVLEKHMCFIVYLSNEAGSPTTHSMGEFRIWKMKKIWLANQMYVFSAKAMSKICWCTPAGEGGGGGRLMHWYLYLGLQMRATRKWLKLSNAATVDWRLYSTRQSAESGDNWQEANNLSVCMWVTERHCARGEMINGEYILSANYDRC